MKKFAWVLIAAFCLSICSCSKKTEIRQQDYITDGIWFSNTLNYTEHFDEASSGSATLGTGEVIYADSERFITFSINYINGSDEMTGDSDDVAYLTEYKINEEGEDAIVESRFDLIAEGLIYNSEDYTDTSNVKAIVYGDEKIYAMIEESHIDYENYENSTTHTYVQEFDLESDSLGRVIENDTLDTLFDPWGGYIIKTWNRGDNQCFFMRNMDNYSFVTLNSDFEIVSEFEISCIDSYDQSVEEAYITGEDELILQIYDYNLDEYIYLKVELETEDIITLDDLNLSYNWQNVGYSIVSTDREGVKRLNIETGETETILDFNNCNTNRSIVAWGSTQPLFVEGDTVILYTGSYKYPYGNEVWKFTREDSNPNVGKEIIRVADLDGVLSLDVSQAIYEFNETSETAYMVMDDRYEVYTNLEEYTFEDTISEEYVSSRREAEAAVSNQLRVDILSGEGPDIILDAFNYSDLTNSECMLNIRNLILDNTIGAISSGNNPIYQIPLSVGPLMLAWRTDTSEYTDGYTVTYDNYINLVENKGHGNDPLSRYNGRTDYFIELFNYSFDKFVSGNRVNIDNEDYRAMAEFVMTRELNYTYDENDYYSSSNSYVADYIDLRSLAENDFTSFPGADGIMLTCDSSVAIAASCPNIEAAENFVRILISENEEGLVEDRIHECAVEMVEYWNRVITRENEMYGDNQSLLDETVADMFTDIMNSATGIYRFDPDINVILYEEMQPYFAGDKTLDEVIPIIEDRVRTVMNERG